MKMTLSGTSYFAALSDVEPVSVTPVLQGCRVTLEAPDETTWQAWIDTLAVVACDMADEDQWDVTRAIYKDIERADAVRAREKEKVPA